jgi:hypothetical protein
MPNPNLNTTMPIPEIMAAIRKSRDSYNKSKSQILKIEAKSRKDKLSMKIRDLKPNHVDHKTKFKSLVPSTGNLFKEYHKYGPENLEDMLTLKTTKAQFFPKTLFEQLNRKEFARYNSEKMPQGITEARYVMHQRQLAEENRKQAFIKTGNGDLFQDCEECQEVRSKTQPHTRMGSIDHAIPCKQGSNAGLDTLDWDEHPSLRHVSRSQDLGATMPGVRAKPSQNVIARQKEHLWLSFRGHEGNSPVFRNRPKSSKKSTISETQQKLTTKLACPKTWAERCKFYNKPPILKPDGNMMHGLSADLYLRQIGEPDKPIANKDFRTKTRNQKDIYKKYFKSNTMSKR